AVFNTRNIPQNLLVISILVAYCAIWLESFVRQRSTSTPNPDGIDSIVIKGSFHPVLQSLAGTEQYDQHKNSPENRKCREHRPQFILANGRENLLPFIEVKHQCKIG